MADTSHSLVHFLRTMVGAWRDDPRDDAELLTQYADGGSEMAFRVLAWRHGSMVWRTCVRVLGMGPDAEDAFQSTMLTLARKAGRLRREPLAGWLHRVARQASLDAKGGIQRRQRLEKQPHAAIRPQEVDASRTELCEVIDEELARLPEKLRIPLVLRYLEEKTQEEVARVLGCSRRAVQKRFERGETILRERLERRGLTLGAVSVTTMLGNSDGAPAVSACLIENTARAAMAFRSGALTSVSAEAAEKLLHSLSWKGAMWSKWWAVMAVCFIGMGGASGLVAWKISMSGEGVGRPSAPITSEPVLSKTNAKSNDARVDRYGDPLPPGALARIGTVRFRPLKHTDGDGIAFLPDGKTLISANDGYLYFWEWSTGKELRRSKESIRGHQIAVSPDGKVLAAGGEYWNISVYPPQRLTRAAPPARQDWSLEDGVAAFSPDGRMVAWACGLTGMARYDSDLARRESDLNIIYLVDASTGEVKKTLKDEILPRDRFTGGWHLAFSTDGKTLASGGFAGRTILWDVATGTKRLQIDGNGKQIAFLAFLPDGRTLIESRRTDDWSSANGLYRTIRFLDATTGKEQQQTDALQISNSICRKMSTARQSLSPNGKFLAINDQGIISVWNMVTGHEVGPAGGIHSPIRHLIFSSDAKKLVTLVPSLKLWDADTGRLDKELDLATWGWALQASFAAYYSDVRHLEVLYHHQGPSSAAKTKTWSWKFLRWDTVTGKTEQGEQQVPATLMPVSNLILPSAASSDGRWQALILDNVKVAGKKGIALIDRTTEKESSILSEIDKPSYVAFSADGQSLLANSSDGQRLCVWSTTTGKPRMSLDVTTTPYTSMRRCALSSDGRWLAAVLLKDNTPGGASVHVWEVASSREKVKFDAVGDEIQCLEWSPDERLLAGGGGHLLLNGEDGEGTIWLWDVAAGQEVHRFKGHRSGVASLTFSPDGRRLVSGSSDTTALVWDLCHLSRSEEVEMVPVPAVVNELWDALRKPDTAGAWQAMRQLTQHPDVTIPLLRERLLQTPSPDQKVTVLLTQLDNDDFQVRKKAEEQLVKMGEAIESALLMALNDKSSLEVQHSIKNVLNKVAAPTPSGMHPSQLQASRAVAVLEWIGSPAARQVLEELSRLPAGLVQMEESKAALQRLAKPTPGSVR